MAPAAVVELPLTEPDDCVVCADRLRTGLANHRGVVGVEPVADRDAVRVSYDPDLCSLDCLDEAARGLRLDLESAYAHRSCRVEGMDCADCAQTIERAVSRLAGVTNVAVSFPTQTMRIEYQPAAIELERVAALVGRLGYDVVDAGAPGRRPRAAWWARERTTLVSAALLLAALVVDLTTGLTAIPLYAGAILVGGLPLARSGVAALLATRRPDINLLMTIAAVGAAAIGAWLEAALVVVLFSIGELLEGRAVDRARRELAALVSLTPETARVRRRQGGGAFALVEEVEVPVTAVAVGDLVVVRPGERMPVDGRRARGRVGGRPGADHGRVDARSTRRPGDDVFAGTLNGQGLLLVEVDSAPGDTTLDRIGKLVTEAQARKSPSERWVDSFARWYTPAVVAVAVLVAAVPPLFGVAFATSFYSALALLILACPCALVISTPVAIVSALGRASAAGVLVKGGAHLEQAARDAHGRLRQDRDADRGPAGGRRARAARRRRGRSARTRRLARAGLRAPARARDRSRRAPSAGCLLTPVRGLRGADRARRPRPCRRRGRHGRRPAPLRRRPRRRTGGGRSRAPARRRQTVVVVVRDDNADRRCVGLADTLA